MDSACSFAARLFSLRKCDSKFSIHRAPRCWSDGTHVEFNWGMRMVAIVYRILFLPMLITASAPALADSVSGQFTLDGKPLKPAEVAAFRVADDFRPGKMSTLVMLTATPVNKAAIAKSSAPEMAAVNDPAVAKVDNILVYVADIDQVSLTATIDAVQYAHSTQMGLIYSCAVKTPEHVTCTVKTDGPVKLMDGKAFAIDLAFDASVVPHTADK